MVTRAFSCDHDRLRLLLEDELSKSERAVVEEHLDECDSCCATLESFAGDESWWKDASSLLTTIDGAAANDGTKQNRELKLLQSSPLSSVENFVGEMSLDFLEASDSPAMLGRLGQYDIVEPLGCGGMGIVLKGYDQDLNRYLAIKVLAPHYATSAAARKRFAREAQASAAVVHPHVVAIHGVSSEGALPYLVMPYVQGESLQQRIDAAGPLRLKETLRITMQAARGLQAAHEQGIVHRDIKPGNILLERGVDRVLLTDFGLARAVDDASMTRSGVIAGTPQYMSPEQARGDAVDHRSDLFSLGSVVYTMCAGRPPFRADNTMGLLNRIVEGSPRPLREVNPDVPEWLATIVERLHSKLPEDRFASAGELADLIEKCLAHVQQPQTERLPDSLLTVKQTQAASRRVLLMASALTLCIAVLFFSSGGLFPTTERDQDSSADRSDGEEKDFESGLLSDTSNGQTELIADNKSDPFASISSAVPTESEAIDWESLSEELNEIADEIDEVDRLLEFPPSSEFEQGENFERESEEDNEAREPETPDLEFEDEETES